MVDLNKIFDTVHIERGYCGDRWLELIDFEYFPYNILFYFEKIKEGCQKEIKRFIKEQYFPDFCRIKCERHSLPFSKYYRYRADKLWCPSCPYGDSEYCLYYNDYKYVLNFKIEKIYLNIKNSYELIKSCFYSSFIKYYEILEGNRKKRFFKNYNSMFKKIDTLKNYINECVEAYKNNRFGIIYLLYYFPEIKILKFDLDEKNFDFDQDKYIGRLSSYFNSFKWFKLEREHISIEEEKTIFDKNFQLTTEKKEINNIKEETIIYNEKGNSEKLKISKQAIKYIVKKNKNIYCIIKNNNNHNEILVLLETKIPNEYNLIYKKDILKFIKNNFLNEEISDDNNNNNKDYKLFIKIYNKLIYIITNKCIILLNEIYEHIKTIFIKIKFYYLNNIYTINKILFIFGYKPKTTIIFNLNTNQIISIIPGLSCENIFKIKNSHNHLLFKDDDKLMLFNYKLYKLIKVHFFHEIYTNKNEKCKGIYDKYYKYNEEYFHIIYKNNIIGKLNIIQLKYLIDNYKNVKFDYILNKENYLINIK